MSSQQRAIFLDRDGVLIRAFVRDGIPHPPSCVEETEILPGVPEALGMLASDGFALLVVTNQPDVARGTQSRQRVEAINACLMNHLPIDRIYTCYHDDADRCACRKPAPGMLLTAAAEHDIDLSASFIVGDRGSDVVAGAVAGCRTFLLARPYSHCNQIKPDHEVADLMEAAEVLLTRNRRMNAA
jgi:D-glycero-D-manno-heptose 1,7-bisphosphate phosphatase